jgi:hypothetical protein
VSFDEPQQVGLRNLIFQAKVVEQRFRARLLPHHDEHASENGDPAEHGKDFFLAPRSATTHLLITVTFSTPTPVI